MTIIPLNRPPVLPSGKAPFGVNVKDFGAVGDGVTDDYPAFRAALDSFPHRSDERAGAIFIPAGDYYLSQTLHINRVITLAGEHGFGWYPAARLVFPVDTPGLVVDYYLDNPGDNSRGDWTVIRDLGVLGQGATNRSVRNTNAHAISLHARVRMSNFGIWNFAGDGIHLQAGVPNSNANLSYFDHGTIYYCNRGVFTQGNDANAGTFSNIDCSYSWSHGFMETSFLGNTYIACHGSSNGISGTGATYWADGAVNCSVFLGCYAEGGDPTESTLRGGAMFFIGGVQPAFDSLTTGTVIHDGDWKGHQFRSLNTKSAKQVSMEIGELGAGDNRVFTLTSPGGLLAMIYERATAGWWSFGSDTTQSAVDLSDATATAGAGQIRFANGFHLGIGGTQRKHISDFAAPTTGSWAVGDIVYNVNPTAGGFIGWVCTAAGTPGTWKTWGAITP